MAQRLVRKLCPECKAPYEAPENEVRLLGLPKGRHTFYHPKGCSACNQSGFRGRTGIYELVRVDDTMRTMIHDGAGEHQLEAHARTMTPGIRDDGRAKVLKGITTLEEVVRVTQED